MQPGIVNNVTRFFTYIVSKNGESLKKMMACVVLVAKRSGKCPSPTDVFAGKFLSLPMTETRLHIRAGTSVERNFTVIMKTIMKNHNKLKDALINAQHFVILDLVLLVLQLLTIFVHAAKLNKWVDVETRLSAWKYVAKNSIVVSIIVLQLVILGIVTSVMKSLSKLVFVNGNW